MSSRRTTEQRAEVRAKWYEKSPATLTRDECPAPNREINIERRCLSPLYALGWELEAAQCRAYVSDLRDPSFHGGPYDVNLALHQRWRRLQERERPFISLSPPQMMVSQESSVVLRVMFNSRPALAHFVQNREAIVEEMMEFMQFPPEMKEKLLWHQSAVKFS
ncbi:hypothetical protein B0H19DRAFT_1267508 [Mycena capillaripes]|nr:hypothetical protein B0H19DRAFT_1267508 [Mycena capillaripes]